MGKQIQKAKPSTGFNSSAAKALIKIYSKNPDALNGAMKVAVKIEKNKHGEIDRPFRKP